MLIRRLGRSGIEVSAIGLGCWAIGGPHWLDDGERREPFGWGQVDDEESVRAIHRALDLGVNLLDTANNYGAGQSERVLGRALRGRRHNVVISTKFATMFDEETRTVFRNREMDINPQTLSEACEASLRRLNTDFIDLYLLHHGEYDKARAWDVVEMLERLVEQGKVRWYGWSTDDPERARIFAEGPHCAAIEHRLNVMFDAPEMLALCDQYDLASINKSPLNGGILTGKFTPDSTFPEDDGRRDLTFREGRGALRLRQVAAVRPVLTADGRSMTQGALAWILTRSERAIPIPGFKTVAQVEENVGATYFDLFTQEQMDEVADRMRSVPA